MDRTQEMALESSSTVDNPYEYIRHDTSTTSSDLAEQENEPRGISNLTVVASYSCVGENEQTILVPGLPSEWLGIPDYVELKPDTGLQYIDQNAGRWPHSPMEPLIQAVSHLHPDFDYNTIDLITDRHVLAKLLELATYHGGGEERMKSFEFGVQVVKNTVIFIRIGGSTPVEAKGCREAIEQVTTKQYEGFEDCQAHYRILRCSLANLTILIRHGADAYIPDDTDELGAALRTHKDRTEPPRVLENIKIESGGTLIPQSAMVELTTAGTANQQNRNPRILQKFRETYLSGAPSFVAAEYYTKTHPELKHVLRGVNSTRDYYTACGSNTSNWERENQETVKALRMLVEDVVDEVRKAVEKGDGDYYLVIFNEGKLLVRQSRVDVIPGLAAGVCRLW